MTVCYEATKTAAMGGWMVAMNSPNDGLSAVDAGNLFQSWMVLE